MTDLQFVPFSSTIDSGFWHMLSKNKLEEYGLKDEPVPIHGFYSNSHASGLPCFLSVEYTAFNGDVQSSPGRYHQRGTLINTNTIDQFKSCDKQEIIRNAGNRIWQDIMSGSAVLDPTLLDRFVLLTFANLKKYHYIYWFAFPALSSPESVKLVKPAGNVADTLTLQQISQFLSAYDQQFKSNNIPYFAAHVRDDSSVELVKLSDLSSQPIGELIFIFTDPSTLVEHPGWTLRNYLCLISRHFVKQKGCTVKLLGLRDRTVNGQRDISHSIYIQAVLSPLDVNADAWQVVGWEKNSQQKLLPRSVNMSKSMDPAHLAESAVDLNLKLMRWRLLPQLDLESVSKAKCLLLGAGTLGCNVARNLLGWGVRNLTLVDNSTVSFSNPVRQSLFTFEHCKDGGLPKAETAAKSLQLIFPGVNARGLSLTIPMPGHPVPADSLESVKKDVKILEELIEEHDAVFLLMDTRESRWLPTVIAAAKDKIVMTAALGFDTWLAMRHGSTAASALQEQEGTTSADVITIPGHDLGCYYCNDVVAPRDSTKDRTLDQQCTVSRPGLSMLCSALIVELFVSLLQHPARHAAPAHLAADEDNLTDQCTLGILPHQMRGYLSRYQIILPVGRKFTNCTACSKEVISEYEKEGFSFLEKAFNDANYLEELSGLSKLQVDPLGTEVMSDFDLDEDDW